MALLTIEKVKLLKEAYDYCEDNDKSTEYMLEYMQNFADVELDDVIEYLKEFQNFKQTK